MGHTQSSTAPLDRTGEGSGALRLLLVTPGGATHRNLPPQGRLTLGRSSEADLVVDDPSVSRVHVALHCGRVPMIEDLGSSNGTRLRGRPLARGEAVPLGLGQPFEFGSTFGVLQPAGPAATSAAESVRDGAPPERGMRARVVLADPAMQALHELIARVSPGEISVLLLGETGVGKEVLAERVHALSRRAKGPFLRVNCAALSESLLESELFGHEKGAFTGAASAREGLFVAASGGTLFLDEVGETTASLQVKLLRVLEERRVTPVGSSRSRPVDVRVVAATHRDLDRAVADGTFRADLRFRLEGIALVIPPLRERPSEIEPLAALFLEEASRRARLSSRPSLSPEALGALRRWRWPGNLRELRNVLERASLLTTDGVIRPEHLPEALRAPARPTAPPEPPGPREAPRDEPAPEESPLRSQVEELERQRILEALGRCAGNQTRAAELLGMPRRTLVFKLARYGIARPRKPVVP